MSPQPVGNHGCSELMSVPSTTPPTPHTAWPGNPYMGLAWSIFMSWTRRLKVIRARGEWRTLRSCTCELAVPGGICIVFIQKGRFVFGRIEGGLLKIKWCPPCTCSIFWGEATSNCTHLCEQRVKPLTKSAHKWRTLGRGVKPLASIVLQNAKWRARVKW